MPVLYAIAALILLAVLAGVVNNYRPRRTMAPGDPLHPTEIPLENAVMIRDSNLRKMINLVLLIIAIGIFLWLINTYVPMARSINAILNIVVVVATCVMVLKVAGLWDDIVRTWNHLIGHRLTH